MNATCKTIIKNSPPPKTLLLGLCFFFITACAILEPKTAANVNTLVDQQEFEKALSLYKKLPPEEQKQIKLKNIEKAQSRYLSTLLKNVSKKQKSSAFYQAQSLLADGNKKMPNNEKIDQALLALDKAINQYNSKYQLQHDYSYAKFLIEEKPLLDKLQASQGEERHFKKRFKTQATSRKEHSLHLGEKGLSSLKKGHSKTAAKQLYLADKLHHDPRWQKALTQINKTGSDKRRQQNRRQKKIDQQQKAKLTKRHKDEMAALKITFNKALNAKNIPKSRRLLTEIKNLDVDGSQKKWIKNKKQLIHKASEKQLSQDLDQGKKQYSNGDIDGAIKTWKNAQKYAPNNAELNEHIRRAETFQARFKSLNNK